jgi:hypothetical protein
MSIERTGPVPPYWQYIAEVVLIPASGPPTAALDNLKTSNLRWVNVPNYQRGISWRREQVDEFLASESVLLGNVILGQFAATDEVRKRFPHLPSYGQHYHVLVDGLQRLAVGTILLALLHDDFLAITPNKPHLAGYFSGLTALTQSRSPAYLHNDHEFRNHPRKAISEQYSALRIDLEAWIDEEVDAGRVQSLADKVTTAMTEKQVAIDVYFNFEGDLALMNTFLGLNTVRVDLGPVDLLRSYIIEKASSDNWTAADIEDVENNFTEVFTRDEHPDGELLPFVGVVLDAIRKSATATKVFPSWSTALARDDVDRFLTFVSDMKDRGNNVFFDEIRACGSNPFSIAVAYYYRHLIKTGDRPSFLTGGSDEDEELHRLLLACYRVLLDGRIGRTRDYAASALGDEFASLGALAEAVSRQFVKIGVDTDVDAGWLREALIKADKNRAKRIFNAYLLPERSAGYGGPFAPLAFGRKSAEFHIDHLIPESLLKQNVAGYGDGNSIRNFAPLPTNQNRVAKATSCSSKLGPNGIYEVYLGGTTHPDHPFCNWLVDEHYPAFTPSDLDNQKLLEVNSTPNVGDSRVDHLVERLRLRI